MRTLQIVLFLLGVPFFLAALLFIGDPMGDTLWRAGVAVLLTDLVCVKLWPCSTPT
ncbi:MAG: hypothetical protein WB626_08190 [Bacteroidota bacterium]